MMNDEVTYIVREIVSAMDKTIEVKWNGTSTASYACQTKWARKDKIVTDKDALKYIIQSITPNELVDYQPAQTVSNILDGVVNLPVPFFITGTKMATNTEWLKATSDVVAKTPIIWLLETIQETRFGKGDSREVEYQLRLFFLDETNVKDFYTEDHRDQVVLPMQELAKEFIRTANRDRRFKTVDQYTMKTFSRFGVERDNGVFQNILDANLSGVEVTMSLVKYKDGCTCFKHNFLN